jgi:transcriptional antiterminator NusG
VTDEPNNPTDQPYALLDQAAGGSDAAEAHQVEVPGDATAEPLAQPGDFPAVAPPELPAAEAPAGPDSAGPEAERSRPADVVADGVVEAPVPEPPAEFAADAVAEVPVEQPPAELSAEILSDAVAEAPAPGPPAEFPAELAAEAVAEFPVEEPPAELPAETLAEAVAEAPAPEPPAAPVLAEAAEAEQVVPAEPASGPSAPSAAEERDTANMGWYILKVQSNREDSIREGLLRRVAIAGLDRYFGQVIVPTEKVTEFKGGKNRVTKRKLYPGYLVVQMEINEDTWFLVRETPGIGDFTGPTGHPASLPPHEVARILATEVEKTEKSPRLKISFNVGDHVKINKAPWVSVGQEGDVVSIDQGKGEVKVQMSIFGRTVFVDFGYWELEAT